MTAQSQAHLASRRETSSADRQDSRKSYDHDDPSLRTGEGGLTVWTLQKMLEEKRHDELNRLFDNGLTMNSLPVGMSAGAGGAAFDINIDLINECVSWLALKLWRGKIFFSSNNKKLSEGRNRMRKLVFNPLSPFVPMAKFTTMLLDNHPVAPRARSNLVVLNYFAPTTKPYLIELLAAELQGYDAMVAVKGKYGPVFVGKTWLGKYDDRGEFTAHDPDKFIGYYFLDFNEGALREQREHHSDGSTEEVLDPLPHVDN